MAGGCCGTTPAYIEALVRRTRDLVPPPVEQKHLTCVSSYTHAVDFGEDPVLIGERINPTGKKRFKEALRQGDMDYILNEGIRQQDKGVQVLDVNVGLPEIDEPAVLERTVCRLQEVVDLPLQIDTSDPVAMERALRRYNGKAHDQLRQRQGREHGGRVSSGQKIRRRGGGPDSGRERHP